MVKIDISFEQGIFLGFFWNYFYPRILNWDFRIIPGISLDLSYFTWSSFLMLHEISAISAGLPGGICCLMLFAAEASLFSFLEAMMTLHPECWKIHANMRLLLLLLLLLGWLLLLLFILKTSLIQDVHTCTSCTVKTSWCQLHWIVDITKPLNTKF